MNPVGIKYTFTDGEWGDKMGLDLGSRKDPEIIHYLLEIVQHVQESPLSTETHLSLDVNQLSCFLKDWSNFCSSLHCTVQCDADPDGMGVLGEAYLWCQSPGEDSWTSLCLPGCDFPPSAWCPGSL